MRIQIISDLHLEFGYSNLSLEQSDLLIIAGDLHTKTKGIKWLLQNIKTIPVLYILGNHEYYRGAYPKTLHEIKLLSHGSNIHVLENESIKIAECTFHGCTLWSDFELFGDPRIYGAFCQEKMNDYKLIRRTPSYSKMRSIDTFKIHKYSLNWLDNSLESSTTSKNIVITHHAPSSMSLPEKYKNDKISSAYASNLDEFIKKHNPNYWIHGHIHTPASYNIGSCEIICNPHGYISEPYNGYNPNLIIEI